MPHFYPTFNIALGTSGLTSVYIKDTYDEWQEFTAYEYFKVVKRQNQISEFEMKIYDIQSTEKVYVKEFTEIMFFSENTLVLKGKIQKVTYDTGYGCTISGYGFEASLLNRDFTKDNEKRVQYSATSAQSVAKQLLSTNSDGVSPWIMQPASTGIFDTNYGNISIRFEWANRLKALTSLCEAMDYEWWVSQDEDFVDYFNVAENRPDDTQATVSQATFAITGVDANASQTSKETDVSNMANKIDVLGRGDGENQLQTSTYNASETYSLLSADITDSSTTVNLVDGSNFPTSGTIRVMEEQITYTGKSGNSLTGCTRGANSTTTYSHKKGVFVEKYISFDSAEDGSSIGTNGILEFTLVFKDVIDRETLELIATKELLSRKDPIVRINVIPNEPIETTRDREIGELITITDTESDISEAYRIVGMTFKSDYGTLSLELECSTKSLSFIEQMTKLKQETENLQRYMQGATNIYWFGKEENIDENHPLTIDIFIPDDAIAINKIVLRPYRIAFQGYSSDAISSYRIDSAPLDKETANTSVGVQIVDGIDADGTFLNCILSGSLHNYQSGTKTVGVYYTNETDNETVDTFDSGTATSGSASTLQDTSKSWTTNAYADKLVNIYEGTGLGQVRIIDSNNTNTLTVTHNWGTNPSSDSKYIIYGNTKTLATNNGWNYQVKSEDDLRGKNVQFNILGKGLLGDSGNALDVGDNYSFGVLYNIIDFDIYNPDSEDSVDITIEVDDVEVETLETISVDYEAGSDIDLTDYFSERGWHTITLTPTGKCRLGVNGFVKCFIHSDDTSFPLSVDGKGVIVVSPNTISSEGYRGSNCTGSDGDTNRTLTTTYNVLDGGLLVLVVNGLTLHDNHDFTIDGSTITFLNKIWDGAYIKVLYIKD